MYSILEAEAYGPNNFEYFGKIKTLKRAEKSVQDPIKYIRTQSRRLFPRRQ